MIRILHFLLLAAALLFPAAGVSLAHDEGLLIRTHNQCRTYAGPGPARLANSRNTAFQQCLRKKLSESVCKHEGKSQTHGAKHDIQVDRQCHLAADLVCQMVKNFPRCQSRVTHDCFKTEDLCKQGGRLYSQPIPAFSTVQ